MREPAPAPTDDSPDSADARLSAARHYLATTPIVEDWTAQLAEHLGATPARREQLRALLAPLRDSIESVHVAAMVKHFTAAEISALTVFQASPAGRAIMRKLVVFNAELIPALMPVLRGVVEDALRAAPPREPSA